VTCVLEFQNTKNEMLEPYHGDKLLNTKKTWTLFIINQISTTNTQLRESNVLQ
jgi:hypothetical protein